MKCNHCNKEISHESKYCEHCGSVVELGNVVEREIEDLFKKVIDHLEYVGYKRVDYNTKEGWTTAFLTSDKYSNMIIRCKKGSGLLFSARYNLNKEKVVANTPRLLEIINEGNGKSVLTNFCILDEESTLICFGWYPEVYDKTSFGSFIDLLNRDISVFVGSEGLQSFA